MRVVTQNLLGHHMDWPACLPAVVDWFRRLRPDVLALQEAVVTTGYDQVSESLGALDDPYHVVHHPLREPDGSGISVASRWPLGTVRDLDLQVGPRTADFAASAQLADVHWPHGDPPLLLVNHKPSWATDLEYERGHEHVVVAGDFDGSSTSWSVATGVIRLCASPAVNGHSTHPSTGCGVVTTSVSPLISNRQLATGNRW